MFTKDVIRANKGKAIGREKVTYIGGELFL